MDAKFCNMVFNGDPKAFIIFSQDLAAELPSMSRY